MLMPLALFPSSCSTYDYPASYDANGGITSTTSTPCCNYTMPGNGPSISGLGWSGDKAFDLSSPLGLIGDPAMNVSSGVSFKI
jgi:hypothetical protein